MATPIRSSDYEFAEDSSDGNETYLTNKFHTPQQTIIPVSKLAAIVIRPELEDVAVLNRLRSSHAEYILNELQFRLQECKAKVHHYADTLPAIYLLLRSHQTHAFIQHCITTHQAEGSVMQERLSNSRKKKDKLVKNFYRFCFFISEVHKLGIPLHVILNPHALKISLAKVEPERLKKIWLAYTNYYKAPSVTKEEICESIRKFAKLVEEKNAPENKDDAIPESNSFQRSSPIYIATGKSVRAMPYVAPPIVTFNNNPVDPNIEKLQAVKKLLVNIEKLSLLKTNYRGGRNTRLINSRDKSVITLKVPENIYKMQQELAKEKTTPVQATLNAIQEIAKIQQKEIKSGYFAGFCRIFKKRDDFTTQAIYNLFAKIDSLTAEQIEEKINEILPAPEPASVQTTYNYSDKSQAWM